MVRRSGYMVRLRSIQLAQGNLLIKIPTIPTLPAKGLCESCTDAHDCPMPQMLANHIGFVHEYETWHYREDEGAWDEYSIDLPEFTDDVIEWCPMYAAQPN